MDETLLPILKNNLDVDTKVYRDCWGPFNKINELEYAGFIRMISRERFYQLFRALILLDIEKNE